MSQTTDSPVVVVPRENLIPTNQIETVQPGVKIPTSEQEIAESLMKTLQFPRFRSVTKMGVYKTQRTIPIGRGKNPFEPWGQYGIVMMTWHPKDKVILVGWSLCNPLDKETNNFSPKRGQDMAQEKMDQGWILSGVSHSYISVVRPASGDRTDLLVELLTGVATGAEQRVLPGPLTATGVRVYQDLLKSINKQLSKEIALAGERGKRLAIRTPEAILALHDLKNPPVSVSGACETGCGCHSSEVPFQPYTEDDKTSS